MIRYQENGEMRATVAKCNVCGRTLNIQNGLVIDEFISLELKWGYFSNKDGQIHKFDICQSCYDEMVSKFKIPLDVEENTELL